MTTSTRQVGEAEKGTRPRYVVVPLSMAPYPTAFLDAINGFARGGSSRCLEAIHEEGAWIDPASDLDKVSRERDEAAAKLCSDIIFLRKDRPGESDGFYAEESVRMARAFLNNMENRGGGGPG